MPTESALKVDADHLRRDAFLYVRQSSLRQVFENTESTKRQYALRERAVALGWPLERVHVIDSDLGLSGAQASDRDGFQSLVTEVALGHAGIVLGLEVSRLARNNADWHRLLELAALSRTLILDEDGLYDPSHFNDRLLLGLKGTMSEAELHILKSRLQGGILNKARRGELEMPLPIGLVYDGAGRVVLDPDRQVQDTVRLLFEAFEAAGSACAVVRRLRAQEVLFPRRIRRGIGKGDLLWGLIDHSRVLQILHNPRYAGAFVYGRSRMACNAQLRPVQRSVKQQDWKVLIREAHAGYIDWQQFERNQVKLRQNLGFAPGERGRMPREGNGLLQGRVLCGKCGARMRVHYEPLGGQLRPDIPLLRRGRAPSRQTVPSGPRSGGRRGGWRVAVGDRGAGGNRGRAGRAGRDRAAHRAGRRAAPGAAAAHALRGRAGPSPLRQGGSGQPLGGRCARGRLEPTPARTRHLAATARTPAARG